jgi:hypothetical protein
MLTAQSFIASLHADIWPFFKPPLEAMQGDMPVALCLRLPLYQLDNGIFPSICQPDPLMVVGKIIHAIHPYQKLSYSYHWSSLSFCPRAVFGRVETRKPGAILSCFWPSKTASLPACLTLTYPLPFPHFALSLL